MVARGPEPTVLCPGRGLGSVGSIQRLSISSGSVEAGELTDGPPFTGESWLKFTALDRRDEVHHCMKLRVIAP